MHFRSHGCWRYSLLRSDLLQKSQIRCFDLSGFGASYSSLLPDVISLPQFPFFIVFSAKCHITFIGTQHDLCAFPHDFSVGISCIALCTFPAPSEYWQISSFPSPRIWNIVLPFFCFSFIDHTALCHLLLYLQSGLWSGLHLFLHRYGCFPAQSYQCIIIHIYTVMVHTYLVILRKKRCQLYFRKKTRSQFSAISQYFRLLSRFSDISFPILICTSAIFIYRSPSHHSFFPEVCCKHAPQTTVL